jgi:hypothetical protein
MSICEVPCPVCDGRLSHLARRSRSNRRNRCRAEDLGRLG